MYVCSMTLKFSLCSCLQILLTWGVILFHDFFYSPRGQMISAEDCEFIKKFEVAHSEEKQAILTNEGHQVL